MTQEAGRLVIVGSGISSIAQLTLEAVAWIKAADVVCYALADPITERWVVEHAVSSEDLAVYYDETTTRLVTYRNMADRMVSLARDGHTVVGVFYGHPGVFTSPTHWAIEAARNDGIPAKMLPAVSAEDCLFADLGIDPGSGSCQTLEATEMLLKARVPDVGSHVIVWQIGVLAQQGYDRSQQRSDVGPLVEYLSRFYPPDHVVTHYQGAQAVVCDSVIQQLPLRELADVLTAVTSTLYIPPLTEPDFDMQAAAALGLDQPLPVADEEGSVMPGSPDWYVPLSAEPGRLYGLISGLSQEPSLLTAFWQEPGIYIQAAGLDAIEAWSVLTKNQMWISQCVRLGSGPAAAVSLGLAATEEEAKTFFIAKDGRLVRPKTD